MLKNNNLSKLNENTKTKFKFSYLPKIAIHIVLMKDLGICQS